jgi:hypothetical protein
MKKSSLFIMFLIILAEATTSCKKDTESNQSTLSPLETLMDKMQRIKGTQGGLTISSGQTYSRYNPNIGVQYDITGGFQNLPFQSIKVGDVNLVPYETLEKGIQSPQYVMDKAYDKSILRNLFGKKISIQYQDKVSTLNSRNDVFIETPSELGVGISGNSANNFYRNVPLTWSAANNGQNIYILLAFEPQSVSNSQFRNYSRVSKFYEVPDNGAFTLTESNFQGIPQGALVVIVIARGTTAIGAGVGTGISTSVQAVSSATLTGQIGTGGGGTGGDGVGIIVN